MLLDDPNYKKGFKFDHVWHIVRNFEKFKDNVMTSRQITREHTFDHVSSESENPTPESQAPESPGLSQFSLNLDDGIGGSPSERPIGQKKAKLKKKMDDEVASSLSRLKDDNSKIIEMLEKTNADRQMFIEMQSKNLAFQQMKYEDKILMRDLNSITDPNIRACIQAQQQEILQKRGHFQQPPPSGSNMFNDIFGNIGGSGDNMPDY
ncbi:No apical meristem-associated C-terminal domain-containing protein [Dioscorea alata]|uniref:No apical meristem-associated C-terminal domain-containing protein n=1 Tax=Dioscorea alata TaxID=55571 RepID=A0ACB7VLI4_DIOAL|nr:No apical meristem-associated C-terminal domain-containing protein [Dioscorea alata]